MEQRKLRLITAGLAATSVIFFILFVVFVSLYAGKKCTDHQVTVGGHAYLVVNNNASPNDSSTLESNIEKAYGKPLFFQASAVTEQNPDLTAIVVLAKEVDAADLQKTANSGSSGFSVSDGQKKAFPVCAGSTTVTTPKTPGSTLTSHTSTCPVCATCPPPTTCPTETTVSTSTPKTTETTTKPPPQLVSVCAGVTTDIVFVLDLLSPVDHSETYKQKPTKFDAIEKELKAFADLLTIEGEHSRIALVGVTDEGVVYNDGVNFSDSPQMFNESLEEVLSYRNKSSSLVIDINEAISSLANAKTYRKSVNTMVVVITDHKDTAVNSDFNSHKFKTTNGYDNIMFALVTPTKVKLAIQQLEFIPTTPALALGVAPADVLTYNDLSSLVPFLERVICNYAKNNGPPVTPTPPPTSTSTVASSSTTAAKSPTHKELAADLAETIFAAQLSNTKCERLRIMFLIDISQTIDNHQCEEVGKFVEDFVSQFTVSADMTTMAVITFAQDTDLIVYFENSTDSTAFLKAFNEKYSCVKNDVIGKTDLQSPLEHAANVLKEENVADHLESVVITFTDGYRTYGLNNNLTSAAANLRSISSLYFVGIDGYDGGWDNPSDYELMVTLAGAEKQVYNDLQAATEGDQGLSQPNMAGAIADMYKCPPVVVQPCKVAFFIMEATAIVHESRNATFKAFEQIAEELHAIDNTTAFALIYYNNVTDYYPGKPGKKKDDNLYFYDQFMEHIHDIERMNTWETVSVGKTYLANALTTVAEKMPAFYQSYDTFSPTFIIAGQTQAEKVLDENDVEAAVKNLKNAVYDNDGNRFFGLDVTRYNHSAHLDDVFWHSLFKPSHVVPFRKDASPPFDVQSTGIYEDFADRPCTMPTIDSCDLQYIDIIVSVHDSMDPNKRVQLLQNVYQVLQGFTSSLMEISIVSYGGAKVTSVMPPTAAPPLNQLNKTIHSIPNEKATSNDIASALDYINSKIMPRDGALRVILFVADDFASVDSATCKSFFKTVYDSHLNQDSAAPYVYGLSTNGAGFCVADKSSPFIKNQNTFDSPPANVYAEEIHNINTIVKAICKTKTTKCQKCPCTQVTCSSGNSVVQHFAQMWN